MRTRIARIIFYFSPLWLVTLAVPASLYAKDLIAPTRSLEGAREPLANLNVTSEPPGLEVLLDGSAIGSTPVWRKDVKPGIHELQIGDSPAEVRVRPGETKSFILFRGSVNELPKKDKVRSEAVESESRPKEPRHLKPAEEETPRDLTPWERFLNRTSPSF